MPSKLKEKKIPASQLASTDPRIIARDAYIYGFPLVDSYRIQYAYFVDQNNPEYKGPWNRVIHTARVYTPDDKAVQSPNSDTPYSFIGVDLRTEPLVLTMPEIKQRRYYSAQFIDMYTFNFAYVGSRATGNSEGNYLLAGPHWEGRKPAGIKEIIRCETELAFVLYRTQLFNPNDIVNVRKVQAGYGVQPLSQFLGKPAPPAAPKIKFVKPLSAKEERTSLEFFNILNFVLQFCPTHPTEQSLRRRFARIGIGAGKKIDIKSLAPEMRKALKEGIADAWKIYAEVKKLAIEGKVTSGDVFGSREYLANNYPYRMQAAVDGIYGNSKEEAYYPAYFVDSSGQKMDGTYHRYTMHFPPGQLPPVNAFWSLTLYELPSSLLSANPLNRYLINSAMLPYLKKDADSGLTLYIQHQSPGKDKESNWLPAPAGPFFCAMRLYWPKKEALNGAWKNPSLDRQTATTSTVPVTADNFRRAETDMYFGSIVHNEDGLGKFCHHREPTSIDHQTVIRANRDTLYSAAIFDLDAGPVTITLPDAGQRFMSMMVLDEDQYSLGVVYGAGTYTYTRVKEGTRYILVGIRTLVDPMNPQDIKEVHQLQDAIKVDQKSPGEFDVPNWDPDSQKKVRDALLVLGATLPDSKKMFGTREQVDPVRHLIGTALAWGGNPERDAIYLNITPARNDGSTIHRLKVKSRVPVDGFWSVSVYNKDGYFEKNAQDAYTLNNITAKKDDDGSISIQFGGCDSKGANCLPVMPGWNYLVRLYRPHPEILEGRWSFPEAQPVQ